MADPTEVSYKPARSDSLYFRDLFRTADTEILPDEHIFPDDDPKVAQAKYVVQLTKKSRQLERMMAVLNGTRQPWFRLVEETLCNRVRQIGLVDIWEALSKGDNAKIDQLRIERDGIVRLFESFRSLSPAIDQLRQELQAFTQSLSPDLEIADKEPQKNL